MSNHQMHVAILNSLHARIAELEQAQELPGTDGPCEPQEQQCEPQWPRRGHNVKGLYAQLMHAEARIRTLKQELADANERLADMDTSCSELIDELQQTERSRAHYKTKCAELTEQAKNMEARLSAYLSSQPQAGGQATISIKPIGRITITGGPDGEATCDSITYADMSAQDRLVAELEGERVKNIFLERELAKSKELVSRTIQHFIKLHMGDAIAQYEALRGK